MRIDPRLTVLFGSETRVRTLAVLAGAHRPMTPYRVGKVGSIPMAKVYREIARLGRAGLLRQEGGGWILVNDDLRRFLLRRIRVAWGKDWFQERSQRASRETIILERLRRIPHPRPPEGWKPRTPKRFDRSPIKDQILQEMGLRASLHAD